MVLPRPPRSTPTAFRAALPASSPRPRPPTSPVPVPLLLVVLLRAALRPARLPPLVPTVRLIFLGGDVLANLHQVHLARLPPLAVLPLLPRRQLVLPFVWRVLDSLDSLDFSLLSPSKHVCKQLGTSFAYFLQVVRMAGPGWLWGRLHVQSVHVCCSTAEG